MSDRGRVQIEQTSPDGAGVRLCIGCRVQLGELHAPDCGVDGATNPVEAAVQAGDGPHCPDCNGAGMHYLGCEFGLSKSTSEIARQSQYDDDLILCLDRYKARHLTWLLKQVRGTPLDTGDWCGVILRLLEEAGYRGERSDISEIDISYASTGNSTDDGQDEARIEDQTWKLECQVEYEKEDRAISGFTHTGKMITVIFEHLLSLSQRLDVLEQEGQ